jgi:hypothetical protein
LNVLGELGVAQRSDVFALVEHCGLDTQSYQRLSEFEPKGTGADDAIGRGIDGSTKIVSFVSTMSPSFSKGSGTLGREPATNIADATNTTKLFVISGVRRDGF